MSDGPHRSLPLKPRWKKVAKWAAKDAWTIEEVRDASSNALMQDVAELPLEAIKVIVGAGAESSLFSLDPDQVYHELDKLHARFYGSAIGRNLIEGIVHYQRIGLRGESAFLRGLEHAMDRTFRDHSRSIEEHYFRDQGKSSAIHMRSRLADVHDSIDFKELANRDAEKTAVRRAPSLNRMTGIDDGPAISP